jgi:hypothetical protein
MFVGGVEAVGEAADVIGVVAPHRDVVPGEGAEARQRVNVAVGMAIFTVVGRSLSARRPPRPRRGGGARCRGPG